MSQQIAEQTHQSQSQGTISDHSCSDLKKSACEKVKCNGNLEKLADPNTDVISIASDSDDNDNERQNNIIKEKNDTADNVEQEVVDKNNSEEVLNLNE
jgi:hypothetical protein